MDIRFSRTLNSCKLPQIRYASPERLFERLTDLRFLSIDFLNTFLLTYRVSGFCEFMIQGSDSRSKTLLSPGVYGRSDRARSAEKGALQSGLHRSERVELQLGGRK